MKIEVLIICCCLVGYSNSYGECPNNVTNFNSIQQQQKPFPNYPEDSTTNCLSLVAFIINNDPNREIRISKLCQDYPNFKQKCCVTCQIYTDLTANCISCNNGGSCTDIIIFGIRVSQCLCADGFIGYNCSRTDICKGSSNPCKNEAECVSSNEEDIIYTCNCKAGWAGKNCELSPSPPSPSPPSPSPSPSPNILKDTNNCNYHGCKNGGSCQQSKGTCSCSFGYSGKTCEDAGSLIAVILVPLIVTIILAAIIITLIIYLTRCRQNTPQSTKKQNTYIKQNPAKMSTKNEIENTEKNEDYVAMDEIQIEDDQQQQQDYYNPYDHIQSNIDNNNNNNKNFKTETNNNEVNHYA